VKLPTGRHMACGWLLVLLAIAVARPWLHLADPLALDLGHRLVPPGRGHWFGSDELGRDVLARVIAAARVSLAITIGGTALCMLIGTVLGAVAGTRGGALDGAVRLTIDLLWSVPFIVLVVLVVSVLGPSTPVLATVIGCTNWVGAARVVRAEAAALRNRDFLRAAVARGYSPLAIDLYEVLPNLLPTVFALTAYVAAEVLVLETGLAFLGLGLPPPSPSWGGLLSDGLAYLSSAWWLVATPAAIMTLTLASFQVLARDAGDRHRSR
jgi:peptide/nickel transport system permease protein